MSIEKLEETRENFFKEIFYMVDKRHLDLINSFMLQVIGEIKQLKREQMNFSKGITTIYKDLRVDLNNLQQQLVQKEDKIDVNDIKEVKNLNG